MAFFFFFFLSKTSGFFYLLLSQFQHFNLVQNRLFRLDLLQLVDLQGFAFFLLRFQLLDRAQFIVQLSQFLGNLRIHVGQVGLTCGGGGSHRCGGLCQGLGGGGFFLSLFGRGLFPLLVLECGFGEVCVVPGLLQILGGLVLVVEFEVGNLEDLVCRINTRLLFKAKTVHS